MRNDIDTGNGLTDVPGTSAGDVAVVNPRSLAERYVAPWNEPDPDARRAMVRALWAPAGEHMLEPPDELRQAARALGFEAPTLEVRGLRGDRGASRPGVRGLRCAERVRVPAA